MKKIQLYKKLFLATGIPYGFIMVCFLSFRYGLFIGLISGLLGGLLFGFLMSLILGTVHMKMSQKRQSPGTKDVPGVYQIRKIKLQFPFDTAFDICIRSIGRIKKGKVVKENRHEGKVKAKAGMTWTTFGDEIKFTLTKLAENSTEVEVSSRPIVRTTLVDYGKNLQNIQIIEAFLKEQEKTKT